jgi:hypothetical protein
MMHNGSVVAGSNMYEIQGIGPFQEGPPVNMGIAQYSVVGGAA